MCNFVNYNKIMKKIVLVVLIFSLVVCKTLAEQEFSLGIVVGEPTGLTFKLAKPDVAFDISINFDTSKNYFYVSFDGLKYDFKKITSTEIPGKFPIIYGVGLKLENEKKETMLGLRIIFGLEYIFEDIPFRIFAKLVPTIDIIPSMAVYPSVAIGILYTFK